MEAYQYVCLCHRQPRLLALVFSWSRYGSLHNQQMSLLNMLKWSPRFLKRGQVNALVSCLGQSSCSTLSCCYKSLEEELGINVNDLVSYRGGGPRVVVSTAAFHARVRRSVPGLGGQRNKNVSSTSTCESQYCGEPPWPRGSVLDLRPPGIEFRVLCLEDSVISTSSGGSPGPV